MSPELHRASIVAASGLALSLALTPAAAQAPHQEHAMPAQAPAPAQQKQPETPEVSRAPMQDMTFAPADQQAMHDGMAHEGHTMPGLLGYHPMTREASGTSWVPDATPMDGVHGKLGPFSTMLHGNVDFIWNDQGGPRGEEKAYSQSMAMLMGSADAGPGVLGFRTMISLDPFMGKRGYPLLLQTGEAANGELLVDRQHPHDFFMELAGSYAVPFADKGSAFVYLGYPGEPALGPPTFMHRFSGMPNPEAPIGHHWLDSTHITFGVATAGVSWGGWKIEGSSFTGREPDEDRWDFDEARFDSYSGRLSWNPSPNWALQVSRGELESPEELEPDTDQTRTTASAIHHRKLGDADGAVTLAWGRNEFDGGERDGRSLDAWLLEGAVRWRDTHTLFARAERTEKDELFREGDPLHDRTFTVGKLSVGYIYELPVAKHVRLGLGGLASAYDLPREIEPAYGDNPVSTMAFARLRITS